MTHTYAGSTDSVDDESIARAIAQKLGDTPGVSYSEVANRAIECGRTELAIRVGTLLPTAYVVRREGYVLTRVCPAVCRHLWRGVPWPGPDGGGDYPSQV